MFSKAEAEAYFLAEKQASLVLLIIGAVAIAAGLVLLLASKQPLYKGMAVPLMIVGLLQGVVGYTVNSRSDAQRKDIVYKMDLNPAAIRDTEIPRMEKVMQNFTIYRWVEFVMLLAGIAMFFYARNNADARQWLMGIGIGLALQAAIALSFDYFADKRGGDYLDGLLAWIKKV